MNKIKILYLLFVAVLAIFAWQLRYRQSRQMAQYADAWHTLNRVNTILQNIAGDQSRSNERLTQAYLSSYNQQIQRQSHTCTQLMEALIQQTGIIPLPDRARREHAPPIPDFAAFPPYRAAAIERHNAAVHAFFDSLLVYSAPDSLARAVISSLENAVPSLPRPDQGKMWMALKQMEYTTAGLHTLMRLNRRIKQNEYHADGYLLVIYPESPRPSAGKVFEASVYAAGYFDPTPTLKMSVNKVPIPVTEGMGIWRQVYQSPGDYIATVEIQHCSPLTGEIITYMKQFSIPVHP